MYVKYIHMYACLPTMSLCVVNIYELVSTYANANLML